MLTWFADFPSTSQCVYSLHNMVVAAGLRYDKLPGEWYGPGTACYVVRDLVQLHERNQTTRTTTTNGTANNKVDRPIFRVHVASQGTVYRDAVQDLMARNAKATLEVEKKRRRQLNPPLHPLDVEWEEGLVESMNAEWDSALLLLIPLRLGLKTFNEDYMEALAFTFSLRQSVGVLGGRPRGARWFYGALSDGSKIYGLDPHTVQNAPRRRAARVNGRVSSAVDMSEEYMRSCHTTYPEAFQLQKMDPSVALGFYCRDRADLEELVASFGRRKKEYSNSPELFTVADHAPDYAANVSFAMNDMIMEGSLLDIDDDQMSDEDEYVVF